MAEGVYHDHRDYKSLVFPVDERGVIDGIDEAVADMAIGETRTIRVELEKAFVSYEDDRVVTIPREDLENRSNVDAEEDELVRSETGETGWITAVTDEAVEIGFNHELAGEPVGFELRVLDVRDKADATENGGEGVETDEIAGTAADDRRE